MEYTFCSFTYNQANYILLQLESIKYQITKFGQNIDCYYILADDCSLDDTVAVVKRWIEDNKGLFVDVKYLVANNNQGIVANYSKALRNISTKHFRILAGDDILYKNNVFELVDTTNVVISPLLYMGQNNDVISGNYRFYRNMLSCGTKSDNIKKFLLSQYRFGVFIESPGIFIDKSVVDEKLFEALKPFKWIEDAAEFHHIISQKTTNITIAKKPYVVYRVGAKKKNGEKSVFYYEHLRDVEMLDSTIQCFRRDWPRLVNPFFYLRSLERASKVISRYICSERRKEVKQFNCIIRQEERDAQDYINSLAEVCSKSEIMKGR